MTEILSLLPSSFIYSWVFFLGVIIGSFLNVYLYRFHTNKSLMGSSHCLSCSTPLRPYELIPILSYVALRGRCRTCHSYIPPRYFLVELTTGLLFLLVATFKLPLFLSVVFLFIVSLLVVIAVYDLYHMIIPDELTFRLLLLSLIYNFYLIVEGMPLFDFYYAILAAMFASGFFFLLWRVSKGTWIGFGDVKLVFPLALIVGYGQVFSLVVVSFWIGAIIGLILLSLVWWQRRGQHRLRLLHRSFTIKSAVPFAPFLILSFLTVITFGLDVVALLSYG